MGTATTTASRTGHSTSSSRRRRDGRGRVPAALPRDRRRAVRRRWTSVEAVAARNGPRDRVPSSPTPTWCIPTTSALRAARRDRQLRAAVGAAQRDHDRADRAPARPERSRWQYPIGRCSAPAPTCRSAATGRCRRTSRWTASPSRSPPDRRRGAPRGLAARARTHRLSIGRWRRVTTRPTPRRPRGRQWPLSLPCGASNTAGSSSPVTCRIATAPPSMARVSAWSTRM
jgi:hypothetical protein